MTTRNHSGPLVKRTLEKTDLQIAPLVFGGNVLGWTADKDTSFALLDRFIDAGLNAVDTADVYSAWVPARQGGELETIIGQWLNADASRIEQMGSLVRATQLTLTAGDMALLDDASAWVSTQDQP